jgi:hypothetical protein
VHAFGHEHHQGESDAEHSEEEVEAQRGADLTAAGREM